MIKNEINIETESQKLKLMVCKYDSELFIKEITYLLSILDLLRERPYPFHKLDSPFRQLIYLAYLNLTSSKDKVQNIPFISINELDQIITQSVWAKAGYFDLLIPEDYEKDELKEMYKISLTTFFDYHSTGVLNYVEQEIEKTRSIFISFDRQIEDKYKLKTEDFITIYLAIHKKLVTNINNIRKLLEDIECKAFYNQQHQNRTHPKDWKYNGKNLNVKEFIECTQDKARAFTIKKEDLLHVIDEQKLNIFFDIFEVQREEKDFLYYTQENLILKQPLFKLNDGRYIVISLKQFIHAIYNVLKDYIISIDENKFYKERGKYLQNKIVKIFENYFKKDVFIYNEYKVNPQGDGQDILILGKGLCLIIEAKSGKEAEQHRLPKDLIQTYKNTLKYFKRNIQEGYDQAFRVKRRFIELENFHICDVKGKELYFVNTKKYHNIFSLIVTMDRFRHPQIDLSHMLHLNAIDNEYPLSINIDDLEIILLTLYRYRLGPSYLIRFLKLREKLHGRILCDDELEIWAEFIVNPRFTIPENKKAILKTNAQMINVFDYVYMHNLGFEHELDKGIVSM